MRLSDGTIITKATAEHKFGGDPMAEYLHHLAGDSGQDEDTGDACDWHYHVARFGKRLLITYPNGFVDVQREPTEIDAVGVFETIATAYDEYLGDDD